MANYDAVIVGSGATGGWAAKQLTEAGLNVALVEAGESLDPSKFTEHLAPYEMPYRGLGHRRNLMSTQPISMADSDDKVPEFYVNELENPYSTAEGKPFSWIRSRQVGGRTIIWGRRTPRFSEYDFRRHEIDGEGADWPLRYAELARYYDVVEDFIGVSGSVERLDYWPDGKYLPPMPLRCTDAHIQRALAKVNRRLIIPRIANLTRNHRGRVACHYCGPCWRGCSTGSYFSSPVSTLPAAAATGRLTLLKNRVVARVLEGDGKATGIEFVERKTLRQGQVKARVVILCCSTLESTRLLLNSANQRFPNGLCNSSGALGHYLMDNVTTLDVAYFPNLRSAPVESGLRPTGVSILPFRNLRKQEAKDFVRNYYFAVGIEELKGSLLFNSFATGIPGFGAKLKQFIRKGPVFAWFLGFGETLPRYENHVALDREKKDAWGIPTLRIEYSYSDNELAMARDMHAQAQEMITTAGGVVVQHNTTPLGAGTSVHEVGTTRMGNNPKTSVLNSYNQAHDMANVFVMDGGAFASVPCANPTLTMMALTVRSCEHIVGEMSRRNL